MLVVCYLAALVKDHREYVHIKQPLHDGSLFASANTIYCAQWIVNSNGRNDVVSPFAALEVVRELRQCSLGEFRQTYMLRSRMELDDHEIQGAWRRLEEKGWITVRDQRASLS